MSVGTNQASPFYQQAHQALPGSLITSSTGFRETCTEHSTSFALFAGALEEDQPETYGLEEVSVGEFQILEKVGRGASADVYKAFYDGQLVALKVLRLGQEEQKKRTVLFLREAQALRAAHHPNIIGFKGLFKLPSALCYQLLGVWRASWVMIQEYAEFGPLSQLVREQAYKTVKSRYTNRDALGWALDIARALQALHSREPKFIHRDVKLDNVLLTTYRGRTIAKLCDFGLHVVADAGKMHGMRCRSNPATKLTYQGSVGSHASQGSFSSKLAFVSSPEGSRHNGTKYFESTRSYSNTKLTEASTAELNGSNRSAGTNRFCNVSIHGRTTSEIWMGMQDRDVVVEFDKVFNLTGITGSYYYMAPEVFKHEPYNEKADIFSFGVVLYEMLLRDRIASSTQSGVGNTCQDYAREVSQGYRPPRPEGATDSEWSLVEACWAASPSDRPTMAEVVAYCELLLDDLAPKTDAPGCRCSIC